MAKIGDLGSDAWSTLEVAVKAFGEAPGCPI